MVTGFNAFKYFSRVLIMREVGSVVVLSLMLFKAKPLKSGEEKFNRNFLIYSFVKSNFNGMYPDLRLGLRMKITFSLSKFLAYCSIKL